MEFFKRYLASDLNQCFHQIKTAKSISAVLRRPENNLYLPDRKGHRAAEEKKKNECNFLDYLKIEKQKQKS